MTDTENLFNWKTDTFRMHCMLFVKFQVAQNIEIECRHVFMSYPLQNKDIELK